MSFDALTESLSLSKVELTLVLLCVLLCVFAGYAVWVLRNTQRTRAKIFDSLVSTLGHDLRGPLQSIQSSVSLLGGDLSPQEKAKFVDIALTSVSVLSREIEDIVRLVRGIDLAYRPVPTDIQQWFDSEASKYRTRAEARGLQWFDSYKAASRTVCFDPERLSQCVGHLLDNAIRYSEVGDITFNLSFIPDSSQSATNPSGKLLIEVRDTGAGIEMAKLPLIFKPFAVNEKSGSSKNLSLGLPIAHAISRAAKGSLTVQSNVGAGTVFTLALPVEIATLPVQTVTPNKMVAKAMPENKGAEVLIVDTDESIFAPVTALLRDAGFDVVRVDSEAQALELIAKAPYGVVITCITADVVNGFTYADRKKRPSEKPYFIALDSRKNAVIPKERSSLFGLVIDPNGSQEHLMDAVESGLKRANPTVQERESV